jgi:hypothetical protein
MEIEKGYLDFKSTEEDMLLFGKNDEIQDLQRGLPDYSVVAVTK